jgi:hypothetical protein
VTIASYYGHVNDIAANQALFTATLRQLHDSAASFIVAGDFNVAPTTVAGWIHASPAGHAKVFDAGPTCHTSTGANCIDYFVLSGNLTSLPWRLHTETAAMPPHSPVRMHLQDTNTHGTTVRYLNTRRRPKDVASIGPHYSEPAWTSWQIKTDDFMQRHSIHEALSMQPRRSDDFWEELDDMWGQWEHLAAAEISSTIGLERDERPGHSLVPEQVRPVYQATRLAQESELLMAAKWLKARAVEALAGRATAEGQNPSAYRWRRGLRSAWRRRFARCHRSFPEADTFLADIGKTYLTHNEYQASLRSWLVYWEDNINGPIAQQRRELRKVRREELYTAIEEAKASAYLRLRHFPPPVVEQVKHRDDSGREYYTSSLPAVVEAHRKEWAKWWDEEGTSPSQQEEAPWRDWHVPLPPPLEQGHLRAVARSFKSRTSCVDGWHPRHIAAMSEKALHGLISLFRCVEAAGDWPPHQRRQVTQLIGKPTGGLRPIALFHSIHRVYY